MSLGSVFKALFGVRQQAAEVEPVDYKGYLIFVEPRSVAGQYGVGARIQKVGDETRVHHFIRADMLPSEAICQEVTLRKAKQTIDQMGDRIFS